MKVVTVKFRGVQGETDRHEISFSLGFGFPVMSRRVSSWNTSKMDSL